MYVMLASKLEDILVYFLHIRALCLGLLQFLQRCTGTVQVGLVPHPHQNNTSILSCSTHDNSTTMAPIDKAIEDLKLHEQDEDFSIRGIAKKHGVEYSTLRRRWTGQTGPRAAGHASQQLLSPQQEEGLVEYIGGLTAYGIPPTRAMIRNFASNISKQHVGNGWVTRFINRNHDHLISK
jgi:hypothetical protein